MNNYYDELKGKELYIELYELNPQGDPKIVGAIFKEYVLDTWGNWAFRVDAFNQDTKAYDVIDYVYPGQHIKGWIPKPIQVPDDTIVNIVKEDTEEEDQEELDDSTPDEQLRDVIVGKESNDKPLNIFQRTFLKLGFNVHGIWISLLVAVFLFSITSYFGGVGTEAHPLPPAWIPYDPNSSYAPSA